jgi:hypothetical protein
MPTVPASKPSELPDPRMESEPNPPAISRMLFCQCSTLRLVRRTHSIIDSTGLVLSRGSLELAGDPEALHRDGLLEAFAQRRGRARVGVGELVGETVTNPAARQSPRLVQVASNTDLRSGGCRAGFRLLCRECRRWHSSRATGGRSSGRGRRSEVGLCRSEGPGRRDPTAVEVEDLGQAVEMVVVVQDPDAGLLRGGSDQRVGELDAMVTGTPAAEITKRSDRGALDRDRDRDVAQRRFIGLELVNLVCVTRRVEQLERSDRARRDLPRAQRGRPFVADRWMTSPYAGRSVGDVRRAAERGPVQG